MESLLAQEDVWSDRDRLTDLTRERNGLAAEVQELESLQGGVGELAELVELAAGEGDAAMLAEVGAELEQLEARVQAAEVARMFSGETDANNAFLTIQSGAGGAEAQDWAEMLLRMYLRWAERHSYQVEVQDRTEGEVAGIKSAALRVCGRDAFGWLRTEGGVHRLVRKSPFDSGNRRHTSFASVFVTPELDDTIEVEIDWSQVRVDTYRASGAGGQHVNKTDSAVRMTHMPTNTVVQCQSERSQHQNRERCEKQLRARLYELAQQEQRAERAKLEEAKSDIGWGHQIRSYVLDSGRIKDLRTGAETGNTKAVLDGDLDDFIRASLRADL